MTATLALGDVRQARTPGNDRPQPVADLAVRLNRPEIDDDAQWVYALGWPGGGTHLDRLARQADGSWRSTRPVPVGGTWKTFVRVHAGRTMLSVPVRMSPDPAIAFAGFPAQAQTTRVMVADTDLMQIERRRDAPMSLWTPATIVVLGTVLGILILMAAVSGRLGRMRGRPPSVEPPPGLLLEHVDRVLARARHRDRETVGV